MPPTPGSQIAVGLLAGPEDFARLRRDCRHGLVGRLWRQMQPQLDTADAATLALAAAIDGDPVRASQARAAALKLAHQPPGSFVDHDAGCMSLGGMHAAHQLCLATDWLWPVLNRDQREAMIGALVAKCVENLTPMPDGIRTEADGRGRLLLARRLDRDDPCCLHPRDEQVNNWDTWFAGALYMAACLAERAYLRPEPGDPPLTWGRYYNVGYDLTPERIARWKAIARERIATALRTQVGPDGDYAEGINYAAYGGNALLTCLCVHQRDTGEDLFSDAIFRIPAWRRGFALGALGDGAVNFNDSKLVWRPATAILACLAARSRDPRIQGMLLEELDFSAAPVDFLTLLWATNDLDPEPTVLPETQVSRHTGTVIWRPPGGRDGLFVALQSGAHGGAHQHRDRNNLFLAWGTEPLLVDTGDCRHLQPPYPDYAETVAHNCLLIDGQGQIGDNQQPVAGQFVEHDDRDGVRTALLDASACYASGGSVRRRAVLVGDFLVLADRVEGATWLTWLAQGYNRDGLARWECRGREAVLHRPAVALHAFFLQTPRSHAVAAASMDDQLAAILRLAVELPAPQVTVVLTAVPAGAAAPVATWDGGRLRVTLAGQTCNVEAHADRLTVDGRHYGW